MTIQLQSGEMPSICTFCECASFKANHFRNHLKTHKGVKGLMKQNLVQITGDEMQKVLGNNYISESTQQSSGAAHRVQILQ